MSKTASILLALLAASCAGKIAIPPAGQPEYRRYRCARAATAPVIDGKLDDTAWEHARWSNDYVDIEGSKQPDPWLRTRMKMLWDDTYLYVAAEMEEPHLWGTLTKRDSVIYHDNDFEVFVDPDGDTHHYFELEINALGTVWDLLLVRPYRDGGPPVHEWDIPGLRTAVHLDGTLNDPSDEDRGWSVEIAIPWEALKEGAGTRVPPRAGDRWRMNFSRVQWDLEVVEGTYRKVEKPKDVEHPEHNWVWTEQGAIAMHQPETWGVVEFAGPSDLMGGEVVFPIALTPEDVWRHRLFGVYDAQRAWKKEHGVWSDSPRDLRLPRFRAEDGWSWPPTIEATTFGYDAWIDGPDGVRLHLREDGRIRLVKPE